MEGRGSATIHDVNLSTIKVEPKTPTNPKLENLFLKKSRIGKALERCTKSIVALESFLDSVKVEFVKPGELVDATKDHDASGVQLEELEEKIEEE